MRLLTLAGHPPMILNTATGTVTGGPSKATGAAGGGGGGGKKDKKDKKAGKKQGGGGEEKGEAAVAPVGSSLPAGIDAAASKEDRIACIKGALDVRTFIVNVLWWWWFGV